MNFRIEKLSFEAFHADSFERAGRYALRLTRNVDDASDLTQEAFFRALKGFERWENERPHIAWLMQIIKNTFLDQLRAKKRRPESVSVHEPLGSSTLLDVADGKPNAEELTMRGELSGPIEQAFLRLSAEQRMIISDLLQGVSYKSLAVSLGCRLETVKTRVHRARTALRRNICLLDPSFIKFSKVTVA